MRPAPDESLDIGNLLSQYASGRWTVDEVMDSVLERIANCPDPSVFIDLLPRAEIDAQVWRLTDSGKPVSEYPLFGVPFAIKDNIDLIGRPTTAGCPAFSYLPSRSATVVQKLCDAGAIAIGKANLDQFATGLVGVRSPYGACVNSFDQRYISGGSSSGSAVAVARGLVSFSLGTDTAGSGRVPAALNNIVGLKPSRGLLSNAGVVPACKSLDCVSVFALTCADAWKVAQAAKGFDRADPYSRQANDFPPPYRAKSGFRFGVPWPEQSNFFGNTDFQSIYQASVARMIELGGSRVVVDCEPLFAAGRLLYDGPWVAERYGGLKTFLKARTPDGVLPVIREILAGGMRYDAASAFDGIHKLAELAQAARKMWTEIDLLLLPTTGTVYRIEEVEKEPIALNKNLGLYTTFTNLLDQCAIAVPAGFGDGGLPSGVSLIAPAGRDAYLVDIAASFHRSTGLTLGATGRPMPQSITMPQNTKENRVLLAVVGAHLSGQPLNGQLTSRGATLVRSCRTSANYRLYALAGTKPPKPGLVKTAEAGSAIELEVWALDTESFGSFVAEVPPPMVIGTLELEDGSLVKGFLCEPYALNGSTDITANGGWRAYLANR